MGEILWKVVGIEGEPPQGLGWREPRPPGGKMRSDWRTGRGFEEWRREVMEEVGKSTEHTAQGGGDCCLWWEQEKQPSFFIFFGFMSNLKIFIKFVATVHLGFRER